MHALGWSKTVKEILYWFIMNWYKEIQLLLKIYLLIILGFYIVDLDH